MNFKNWLSVYGEPLWEMGDVAAMNASHIKLIRTDKVNEDDFDEDEAWTDCSDEIDNNWQFDSEYSVYDDPEDDPDFEAEKAEDWLEDNPEPIEDNYQYNIGPDKFPITQEPEEDNFKDDNGEINKEAFEKAHEAWEEEKEKFDADHEEWQSNYEEVEDNYQSEVASWEEDMRYKRRRYEDEEGEARSEAINECVQEKRREFRDETGEPGYKTEFEVDTPTGKQNFIVHMEETNGITYNEEVVPNSYTIAFEGPNTYSSTGKAGTSATKIYTQLLLSIKKLMETVEVNGLSFSPAEAGMGLVYQRFYKQYLAKDFMQVEIFVYVRKSYIKEKLKELSTDDKKRFASSIVDAKNKAKTLAEKVRNEKNDERKFNMNLPKMVGQFIIGDRGRAAYVYQIWAASGTSPLRMWTITTQDETSAAFNDTMHPGNVVGLKDYLLGKTPNYPMPPDNEIKELLHKLMQRQDLYAITKRDTNIDQWFQKFGIPLPKPVPPQIPQA